MIETIEISKLEYYNLLLDEEKLRRIIDKIGEKAWHLYMDGEEGTWVAFREATKAKVWPRE